MTPTRGLARAQSRGFVSLGLILLLVVGLAAFGGAGWWGLQHVGTLQLNSSGGDNVEKGKERISMCGSTFVTDVVIKDGVDIGQRIALLVTQEYEQAAIKDHTNCFFIKTQQKDSYLALSVSEQTSEEQNLKGKNIYLVNMDDDRYIIDRQTNEIYNVNAMDGSTRNVIGVYK